MCIYSTYILVSTYTHMYAILPVESSRFFKKNETMQHPPLRVKPFSSIPKSPITFHSHHEGSYKLLVVWILCRKRYKLLNHSFAGKLTPLPVLWGIEILLLKQRKVMLRLSAIAARSEQKSILTSAGCYALFHVIYYAHSHVTYYLYACKKSRLLKKKEKSKESDLRWEITSLREQSHSSFQRYF